MTLVGVTKLLYIDYWENVSVASYKVSGARNIIVLNVY